MFSKSVRKVKTKMTFSSVESQFNPISQLVEYATYSHRVCCILEYASLEVITNQSRGRYIDFCIDQAIRLKKFQ